MSNINKPKKAKRAFTNPYIISLECEEGKQQTIYKDTKTPSLGVRVTSNGVKSYIFESKLNGKNIRITIGDVRNYRLDGPSGDREETARGIAEDYKTLVNKGIDPRQVIADNKADGEAKRKAKEQEVIEQARQDAKDALTVRDAWQDYYAERSVAKKNGKLVWGDSHRRHLKGFLQDGTEPVKRAPKGVKTKRVGILTPLMSLRLAALDDKVISDWLDKELSKAPVSTRKAFNVLRAFLNWCLEHKQYGEIVTKNPCLLKSIKEKVPNDKERENDSLRRAQLKPWFEAIKRINSPVTSAYLQVLLLTGARRNELSTLKWSDVDFQWLSMTIRDKVEGERTIPLTPYVAYLISALPRRNEYVFSSPYSKSGRLEEPRKTHAATLNKVGLPLVTLHGLRRSFSTLAEWVEVPTGIVAQIMGHKPSAVAEKHYIQRELDLLHLWHVRIEDWILKEAGVEFDRQSDAQLKVVK